MEQVGLVKKVIGEKVEVEVKRVSGWGGGCKGCSGSCDTPNHRVILSNDINAKEGDLVGIEGEVKNILKYTMVVYMIPFSMLIIGILLGMKVLKSLKISSYEPLSFFIGLIFMGMGYFIVRIVDKNIGEKQKDIIRITKII